MGSDKEMKDETKNLVAEALRIAKGLESNGQGCTCCAYGAFECGCPDAIWPESYTKDGAEIIRRLIAELALRPEPHPELTASKQG